MNKTPQQGNSLVSIIVVIIGLMVLLAAYNFFTTKKHHASEVVSTTSESSQSQNSQTLNKSINTEKSPENKQNAIQNKNKPESEEDFLTKNTQWQYHQVTDKMRGHTTYTARIISLNGVEFGFPYETQGGSRLMLVIKNTPELNIKEAYLAIVKGQFSCTTSQCSVTTKFNEEIKKWNFKHNSNNRDFIEPADVFNQNLEHIFIDSFIKEATEARDGALIEASFYNEGRHQFEFNLKNFDKEKLKLE